MDRVTSRLSLQQLLGTAGHDVGLTALYPQGEADDRRPRASRRWGEIVRSAKIRVN